MVLCLFIQIVYLKRDPKRTFLAIYLSNNKNRDSFWCPFWENKKYKHWALYFFFFFFNFCWFFFGCEVFHFYLPVGNYWPILVSNPYFPNQSPMLRLHCWRTKFPRWLVKNTLWNLKHSKPVKHTWLLTLYLIVTWKKNTKII